MLIHKREIENLSDNNSFAHRSIIWYFLGIPIFTQEKYSAKISYLKEFYSNTDKPKIGFKNNKNETKN